MVTKGIKSTHPGCSNNMENINVISSASLSIMVHGNWNKSVAHSVVRVRYFKFFPLLPLISLRKSFSRGIPSHTRNKRWSGYLSL